eukprot:350411-Chlamydomonas_euryale.AAC.6
MEFHIRKEKKNCVPLTNSHSSPLLGGRALSRPTPPPPPLRCACRWRARGPSCAPGAAVVRPEARGGIVLGGLGCVPRGSRRPTIFDVMVVRRRGGTRRSFTTSERASRGLHNKVHTVTHHDCQIADLTGGFGSRVRESQIYRWRTQFGHTLRRPVLGVAGSGGLGLGSICKTGCSRNWQRSGKRYPAVKQATSGVVKLKPPSIATRSVCQPMTVTTGMVFFPDWKKIVVWDARTFRR